MENLRELKQALDLVRQHGKSAEKALEALRAVESADSITAQVAALRREYDAEATKLSMARDESKVVAADIVTLRGEMARVQRQRDAAVSEAKTETRALEAEMAKLRDDAARDRNAAVEVYNARVELEREVRELEARKARLEEAIAVLKNG